MNKNKGKKWALNVLWLVIAFNGFKLLAGFASTDPGGAAAMAIMTMIGGIVVFCPIAYAIVYFQKDAN
jgi:hypothetical protein